MSNPELRVVRNILYLASLGFFGFGLWALAAPESMLEMVGALLTAPAARAETRAFYGGMEVGFGIFLVVSARRDAFVAPAALAACLIFFGCALARAAAMLIEPVFSGPLFFSGLGEFTGGLATWWAYRRAGAACRGDFTPRAPRE